MSTKKHYYIWETICLLSWAVCYWITGLIGTRIHAILAAAIGHGICLGVTWIRDHMCKDLHELAYNEHKDKPEKQPTWAEESCTYISFVAAAIGGIEWSICAGFAAFVTSALLYGVMVGIHDETVKESKESRYKPLYFDDIKDEDDDEKSASKTDDNIDRKGQSKGGH